MLALIVLMFIAIDVVILLIYNVYSATQGTLEAVLFRNRERMREEIGVRLDVSVTMVAKNALNCIIGTGDSLRILLLLL